MEWFTLLKALSENQNAESIADLQRQLNIQAATINHNARLAMHTNFELMVVVVLGCAAVVFFVWALYSLTKRVKRLEKVLANVTEKKS